MSYIEDNLLPNEKILLRANIHAAVFVIPVVLLSMLSCAVLFWLSTWEISPWVVFVIILFLLWQIIPPIARVTIAFITTEFAVTNQRIIAKRGWIRRRTTEILLQKVESIKIDQGLLGRLFGYGKLEVVGTGGTTDKFIGVAYPVEFRKNVNRIIDYYAREGNAIRG